MVAVDDSCLNKADLQAVRWLGVRVGGHLALLYQVNSRNDFSHDDSSINIVFATDQLIRLLHSAGSQPMAEVLITFRLRSAMSCTDMW